MPRLTAPTNGTFIIALLVFLVGLLGHNIPQVAGAIAFSGNYYVPVVAFLILMVGNLIRGL